MVASGFSTFAAAANCSNQAFLSAPASFCFAFTAFELCGLSTSGADTWFARCTSVSPLYFSYC